MGVEGENRYIEVKTDPVSRKLMRAKHWPICVTLSRIGDRSVTDPLKEEELCTTAMMSVVVDPEGSVCCVQKSGTGFIEIEEMQHAIDGACARSKYLFKLLQEALSNQRDSDA